MILVVLCLWTIRVEIGHSVSLPHVPKAHPGMQVYGMKMGWVWNGWKVGVGGHWGSWVCDSSNGIPQPAARTHLLELPDQLCW